jgi:hypothetical protein
MAFFETDRRSAADSITLAQHIAFAPIVFQASRSLRVLGILEMIDASGGATQAQIVAKLGLSEYGVRVLLEAGLGIGLLTLKDDVYRLTTAGWYILKDGMTIANMDFSHDVCYEGVFTLDESIRTGKPAGLKVFGDWSTVYQGLAQLAPHVQKSWFAFDHYYSDDAYPLVIPMIAKYHPRSVLDIGGNTGKFALQLLRSDPAITMGIVDLPHVAKVAMATIANAGFSDRVSFHPADMLDPTHTLPKNYGAIWMSQFLDCFSEEQIVGILTKVREALADDALAFILEPFWDRQRREVSAFAMQMTSLYFTGIANGNSQLYPSGLFLDLIAKAGLKVTEQIDNIGVCQSLLVCRKA